MQIQTFIELFKIKIDEILGLDIILPSKKSKEFNPGDWTFLYNCAVYDLVKEYNQKNKTEFSICAEPEAGKTPKGRGAYSDLLIYSNDGEKGLIVIEHENYPHNALARDVRKLSKSKAEYKLLITYHYKNYPKRKIIKELRRYIKKYFKTGETLHLLISCDTTEKGSDYKYEQIKAV